ncbi:hypothetical protein, unlikely [Trypanosoma brucei gambiense DAL972]|uniref:Uncharacterized protein n=1 Tax=Trypanosoma brucei gambiense (strain MHOM/CI/86/DAL972) TaxID=679716 RepID=D0A215_TRYB9|nr:hypothetical protein, unlikely [Trypanosoma brucei gambiense DAL972]CBH15308.1 hypothetical protein, unlikely [Trypanosoma brucei gambiense DAL972]|eukprot:XP_011777573.1 hypothetical protein, unlikely [Trypanosoma brucei gambiense DAL972]
MVPGGRPQLGAIKTSRHLETMVGEMSQLGVHTMSPTATRGRRGETTISARNKLLQLQKRAIIHALEGHNSPRKKEKMPPPMLGYVPPFHLNLPHTMPPFSTAININRTKRTTEQIPSHKHSHPYATSLVRTRKLRREFIRRFTSIPRGCRGTTKV